MDLSRKLLENLVVGWLISQVLHFLATNKPPNGSLPCDSKNAKPVRSSLSQASQVISRSKLKYTPPAIPAMLFTSYQCMECPAQNIGLTKNQFRTRMNSHQQDVKNKFKGNVDSQYGSTNTRSDYNNCFSSKIVKQPPYNQMKPILTDKMGTIIPMVP